jgi:hypothetical protein
MPPGNAGVSPNVIYFLQKEPWHPVFVFAVSGLNAGVPPARRWYTDDSGIKQIVVAAWLLANADY